MDQHSCRIQREVHACCTASWSIYMLLLLLLLEMLLLLLCGYMYPVIEVAQRVLRHRQRVVMPPFPVNNKLELMISQWQIDIDTENETRLCT